MVQHKLYVSTQEQTVLHLPESSEQEGEESPEEWEMRQQQLHTLPTGVVPQNIKVENSERRTLHGGLMKGRGGGGVGGGRGGRGDERGRE